MAEIWEDGLILKALRGSITYGTNITPRMAKEHDLKPSDRDEVGICIPPKEYVIGLQNFEQHEEGEYTVFGLKKYLKLAADCNPNILEPLFLAENHYLYVSPLGKKLLENRHLFLSKKAKHTYTGYAYSQIKRLNTKLENTTGRQELVEKYGYDTKFAD